MNAQELRTLKHELRTPVNHILGYSELLLDSAQDAGDDVLIAQAQSIHRDGRKLAELIDRNFAAADPMHLDHIRTLRDSFRAVLDQIVEASTPNSSSLWLGDYARDLEKIRRAADQLIVFVQQLDPISHP